MLLCFEWLGSIPSSIGLLTKLTYLALDYNRINGTLYSYVHFGMYYLVSYVNFKALFQLELDH